MHSATVPAPVGTFEVAHARLGDHTLDSYAWLPVERSWRAVRQLLASGGPQRQVAAGGMPDDAHPVEVERRLDARQVVDRRCDVGEGGGPAAAVAEAPVLDVPCCPAAPDEVGDEAA